MQQRHVPILVVGGSLTGLSTALFLARHGTPSLTIERHPTTTIQYKFRGISPRSMEIFRDAGVESAIRSASTLTQEAEIAHGRNLADPDITWMGDAWPDTTAVSATGFGTLDQDRLEPILRAAGRGARRDLLVRHRAGRRRAARRPRHRPRAPPRHGRGRDLSPPTTSSRPTVSTGRSGSASASADRARVRCSTG